MSKARTWISANRALAALFAITAVAVVLASGLAVASATDQPAFCGSACHEMGPYHQAWQSGAHANVACVECHVDSGKIARLTHKAEAMKELWVHVSGKPTFPLEEVAAIPNERCVRCHDKIAVTATGFDHSAHASRGKCMDCHAEVGHAVSDTALKDAGIFNASASESALAGKIATVNGGQANVAGHLPVPCSRCHDMAKTGCPTCHKPKHDGTGPATKTAACLTCHSAGATFAFSHPQGRQDCASCHARPATDHRYQGECSTCHTDAGAKWAFSHTDRSNCAQCHPRPAKHRNGACSTCHGSGTTWAFKHPTAQACTSCHNRPAEHRAGSCSTCHRNTGVSWAFSHPSSTACTSCHTRPAKHKAGACTSCHSPGTWKFTHSTSRQCTACHARPAGHKAGSCTTCHRKPGVSWAFSHPGSGVTCTNCHARPAGHRAGACSTCHKTGATWAFRHPGSGVTCTRCHTRPAGHRSGSCTTCHKTGATWAFRHPGSGVTCSNCHARPAGHRSGGCKTCHATGSSWAFRHPSNSATCTTCHARPSGHRSGSCATCHSVGSSWAFRHPTSSSCASCHTAPSGHYGTTCASCHTPTRAWSSATFNHPSVPGGEHTYRSFACSKCHTNGYGSVNCTSCHAASGGDDD